MKLKVAFIVASVLVVLMLGWLVATRDHDVANLFVDATTLWGALGGVLLVRTFFPKVWAFRFNPKLW